MGFFDKDPDEPKSFFGGNPGILGKPPAADSPIQEPKSWWKRGGSADDARLTEVTGVERLRTSNPKWLKNRREGSYKPFMRKAPEGEWTPKQAVRPDSPIWTSGEQPQNYSLLGWLRKGAEVQIPEGLSKAEAKAWLKREAPRIEAEHRDELRRRAREKGASHKIFRSRDEGEGCKWHKGLHRNQWNEDTSGGHLTIRENKKTGKLVMNEGAFVTNCPNCGRTFRQNPAAARNSDAKSQQSWAITHFARSRAHGPLERWGPGGWGWVQNIIGRMTFYQQDQHGPPPDER